MPEGTRAFRVKWLAAFAAIYFVWGSTFLSIKIGVAEVPPFLYAGMRFFVAGLALWLWTLARGARAPSRREWGAATLIAVFIFVFDYGLLFWAETRVPSGSAAIVLATIPAFMALSEIFLLRTRKMTVRLAVALLIGIGGVAVLVERSAGLDEAPVDLAGAAALVVAAMSWAVAAALSRKLPLPADKVVSSGAQMLAGGALLFVAAAALGEIDGFDLAAVSRRAWLALAYLIVAGSIVAFTAYVWLLHHESPTKVGTYAYVNPVVAVLVGAAFGGESLGPRTAAGTLLVLVSVVLITTAPAERRGAVEERAGAAEGRRAS